MIFVTVGTHVQFNRLVKRIDELAPKIKDEIIIQLGSSTYLPKNCKSFNWDESIDKYMEKADLVITHGGLSIFESLNKHNKPTIIVPRQYKYGEHINDHQVEFGSYIEQKYSAKVIYDIKDLNETLLREYRKKIKVDNPGLKNLQSYIKSVIELIDN